VVFLIQRRQVARQPGAVTPPLSFYCTFIVAGSLHRPLPGLRASGSQWVPGCHAPCSSASFVTAATVSFAALHSSAPHFRSIPPVRSSSILRQGMVCIANAQINTHAVTYLAASQRYNTHRVPFLFVRRYFISVLLSPPAAHNFARRLPHFGCA
jgi:hypothetical protein